MDIPLPMDDLDLLRAVGRLCRNLKTVKFIEAERLTSPLLLSQHSDDEVHLVLEKWPKVRLKRNYYAVEIKNAHVIFYFLGGNHVYLRSSFQ